jgi:hypothetical protein
MSDLSSLWLNNELKIEAETLWYETPWLIILAVLTHLIHHKKIEEFITRTYENYALVVMLVMSIVASLLLVKADLVSKGHQAFIYFQF